MEAWSRPLADGRTVQVRATGRAEGDLAVGRPASELVARRRAVVDRPWVWLDQVHGADVVVLGPDDVAADASGAAADGVVTARRDVALAVHMADCATVALVSPEGAVGALHAGWRGLLAGVVPATVAALRAIGASEVEAYLGPAIGPECYEFGADDLDAVAERCGPGVRARTADGAPALDLRAGVRAELAAAGVPVVGASERCTACAAEHHWSHRARRDVERQALVVWVAGERR